MQPELERLAQLEAELRRELALSRRKNDIIDEQDRRIRMLEQANRYALMNEQKVFDKEILQTTKHPATHKQQ